MVFQQHMHVATAAAGRREGPQIKAALRGSGPCLPPPRPYLRPGRVLYTLLSPATRLRTP